MRYLKALGVAIALAIVATPVAANEVGSYMGDGSWQFETPNEEMVDINKLLIREQADGNAPAGGSFGTSSTDSLNGGTGSGSGDSASSIGNYTVIEITGDKNDVNVDQDNTGSTQGSQVNSGDQDNTTAGGNTSGDQNNSTSNDSGQ